MSDKAYEFGQNWRSFIDGYFDEERLTEASRSLTHFLKLGTLANRTFLDIGCGSGLFSLAAQRLGASRVVSIDVDVDSVECCRELWSREGHPESWQVLQGSILDDALVKGLGEFDVVYSWGVLHHTGDLWRAVENAAACVRRGGLLYIAIYNRADGFGMYSDGRIGPSAMWALEKRVYNRLPIWTKRLVDYTAAAGMVSGYLLSGKNPVAQIRDHKTMRGMSWMVDIRDWLGGYPYEYASVAEVFDILHDRMGFSLENLSSTNSLRCNEYLFRRPTESARKGNGA